MTGKRITLILAAWALAAFGLAPPQSLAQSAPPAEEGFLLGAPDIPLMPGLEEDPAAAFLFDKPAGRILTTRLAGCLKRAEVRQFYTATLPQLGWLPVGHEPALPSPPPPPQAEQAMVYLREGERLTIEFAAGSGDEGDCLELRFLLNPTPAEE